MTQTILQQSLPLLFPLCGDIHGVTSALIKDQIKNRASSINSRWVKGSSLPVMEDEFTQMRAAICSGDYGLKCLRASGGAAQWKCTLEGCLTDLWRLISFRLKSKAGKTIDMDLYRDWGIMDPSLILEGSNPCRRKVTG